MEDINTLNKHEKKSDMHKGGWRQLFITFFKNLYQNSLCHATNKKADKKDVHNETKEKRCEKMSKMTTFDAVLGWKVIKMEGKSEHESSEIKHFPIDNGQVLVNLTNIRSKIQIICIFGAKFLILCLTSIIEVHSWYTFSQK